MPGCLATYSRVALLVAQQQRDAVVRSRNDQPAASGAHALGAATAEPVAQHDHFRVRFLLRSARPPACTCSRSLFGSLCSPCSRRTMRTMWSAPAAKCSISSSRTWHRMMAVWRSHGSSVVVDQCVHAGTMRIRAENWPIRQQNSMNSQSHRTFSKAQWLKVKPRLGANRQATADLPPRRPDRPAKSSTIRGADC